MEIDMASTTALEDELDTLRRQLTEAKAKHQNAMLVELQRLATLQRERDEARGRLKEIKELLDTRSSYFYHQTVFDRLDHLAADTEGGKDAASNEG